MIYSDRLSAKQAASYMEISYVSLCRMRGEGRGPRYYKVGKRIFYKVKDINKYLLGIEVIPNNKK